MPEIVELNIHQMLPDDWFQDRANSSVWLSGYRALLLTNADLPSGPRYFDLSGVRVFLVYGKVMYLDPAAATPRISADGDFHMDTSAMEKETPEGAYVVLVLPFEIDGQGEDERFVRDRIADVVGLVLAINDRNMVYEHVFDYVHQLGRNERSVIGQTVLNPFSMPKPDITQARLDLISAVDRSIENSPEVDRNRIRLSLRWYQNASYDIGVDSFLKFWIAIETLSMPDTTNIRPINKALASVYGISNHQSVEKYLIGRIFGLRSRIVHEGEKIPIDGRLLDYMGCVYIDLLLEAVRQPTEGRTDRFLNTSDFDPSTYLAGI